MATSTQGQVLSLQGSVKAIGVDGKARLLKVGDILQPGEQLQLENGAAVSLSRADGEVVRLEGDRQVMLTDEVLHGQHADATEASIASLAPEAQQILAALDNPSANPGNPFDNLDPAAAGLNDAGGENSGHSFIRIGRIAETLTGLQLSAAPASEALVPENRAADIQTQNSPPFFTAANGAPLGSDMNVATDEDTPVSGTLTASDPNGDPLTFVKGSDPQHGTVTVNPNGSWTYTPAQDYNGSDKFTVTVSDGRGGTATVTVNIGVNPVNDPAVITGNDQGAVTEDLNVSAANTLDYNGKLNVADPDQGEAVFNTARVDNKTNNLGSITIDAAGNWHYSVDNSKVQYLGQGETRTEIFTVYSKDGTAHDITVLVNGVNDAADVGHGAGDIGAGAVKEDTAAQTVASGKLTVVDADQGQAQLQPYQQTTDYGTFQVNADGTWTFTIDNGSAKVQALGEGDKVPLQFTVVSKDGSASSVVSIQVLGTNDAAVISGNDAGAVTEDLNVSPANTLDYSGKLNISDVDQGQAVFNTARIDNKTNNLGSITIDANGNWHYSVDNSKVQYLGQGDTRTEVFTVYAKDGTAHDITVVVNGVNDAAVISGNDLGSVTEDLNVSAAKTLDYVGKLNVSDADQGQAVFDTSRIVNKTANLGSITIDAAGNWHYSVDNSKVQYLGQGDTRTEVFTVYSKDGTAHDITVVVNGVNDAAVIGGTDHGVVVEDDITQVGGTLLVKDVDQNQSAFQPMADVQVDYGTFHFDNATGQWTFTLDNAKAQALTSADRFDRTFTVLSLDGTPHTVTVTIIGKDDPADISGNDQGSVTEDLNVSPANTLDYAGKLNVADPDQGQSSFDTSRVDNKTNNLGSITIDANGNWHYSVDNAKVQYLGQGDTRTEVFTVYAKDGTAHDITVVVNGVNDAAVISGNDQGSVTEDLNVSAAKTLDYVGKLNVSDADQGQAVFDTSRIVNKTANLGSITIDAAGNWHYSVDNSKVQYLGQGDTRTEVFTVYSKDGTAHDITVVVNGVNDAAVIGGTDHGIVVEDTILQVGGTLLVKDVDQNQSAFQPMADVQVDYGTFHFDSATGQWTFTLDNAKAQELTSADRLDRNFTVHSVDGTAHTVTVTIQGQDDSAIISGNDTGAVTEDLNVSTANTLDYAGKLDIVDPDKGQAVFDTARVDNKTANLGSITIDADGNWHYSVDNAKVQYLGQGDTRTEIFTVYAKDGTAHDITVVVNGVNDAATFSGNDAGAVTEDLNVSAANTLDYSGKLNVADADQGQASFDTARVDNKTANLGSISIDADGNWHYSVDNAKVQYLGLGDTRTEVFTVYAKDGTAHDITVVVNGVNDAADVGHGAGDIGAGAVKEDTAAQTVASGKLTVVDVDQGQAQLQPYQQTTDYGTFQVNADGTWTFTIDNGSAKVQALGEGDKVPLQFTVWSKDGSASSVVSIQVLGTNDAAVITGNDAGTVTEDLNVSAANTLDYSGKLNVADADQGQASFDTARIDNKTTNLGSITIDADGNWHYSVDNAKVQYLGQGDTRTEVFTVYAKDGTAHDITVVVNGVNDAATFSGNDAGTVTEDLNVSAANTLDYNGKLNVADADQGQAAFDTARIDNKTTNLGSITIDADGNWHYSVDNAKVQYLGQGDTRTEVFTVYAKDGTAHDITVVVNGVNDAATFSGNDAGTVTEDLNVSAANTLDYSGKLNVADADQGQASFDTARIDNKTTNLGSITIDADGNWHYSVDNAKVQYLGQGDTRTEVFTVYAKDGTAHDITVVVNGVNDAATFSGNDAGTVTEDLNVSAANTLDYSGKLNVADADQGQAAFDTARVDNKTNNLGSITIDADGNWHYSVDNAKVQYLGQGDTRTEVFTVYAKDGTAHDITVVVNGVNDAAVISGNDQGSVTEDLNVSAANTLDYSGKLNVADADQGQAVFDTARVDNKTANLGSITIDADGNWHYSVDNAKVQYLGQGDTRTEIFTVYAKDGTAHDITVVVNGVNDAAVISGNDAGMVTEDLNVSAANTLDYRGKLNVADADQGQAVFDTSRIDNKTANLGKLTIDANGNWHYSVDDAKVQYLGQDVTRTEVFTVYSKDGTSHDITVTIKGVNDPAVFGGTDGATLVEGTFPSATGTLLVRDVDTGEAAFRPQADVQVKYGTFHFDSATGQWTFTLNDTAQELTSQDKINYTFPVQSLDGTSHNVNITVYGTDNFAVITGNDKGAVTEDVAVSTDGMLVHGGKLDIATPDKGRAVFDTGRVDSHAGNYGTLTIDKDGHWQYQVDNAKVQYLGQDETRTEVFTVYAKDGTEHKISVDVHGTNDAPVFVGDQAHGFAKDGGIQVTTAEDTPVSGQLHAQDVDANDQLSYATSGNPQHGTVMLGKDGSWTYTPNQDYNGSDSFKVTVTDKAGATDTITIHVGITPVDDPSVLKPDSGNVVEDKTLAVDAAHGLLANDYDVDSTLSVQSVTVAGQTYQLGKQGVDVALDGKGVLHVNADGSYSFAPAAHYAGELPQIGYTTNTGSSSTLTLTMTPVADAPAVGVLIGQGSYQPGSPYVGGRNFESWEKTAAEYGKNAITLDDGNNSFADLRGKTDTGFAVRGMGGNDAIYLDTSKADNVLIGDDGNLNQLSGKPNEVNDTLYAGKGNDILIGGKGDDSLYGGDGVDTAVYAGNFKDYTITRPVIGAGGSVFFEVTDKQVTAANPYAGEGHDSLYDIERLQFKDGTYYWNGKEWAKEGADLTRYPVDISASLVDRDGSETLDSIVVRLDAKYAGSQLFDSQHNLIGTIGKDGTLTIAQAGHWDAKALDVKLSGLQLEVPGSVKGALSIAVDAVSRETGNGDTATGHASANAANMAPETFDVSASGLEDQPLISVALSGKDGDGSVSGFVIRDLPANGTLYSDAAGTLAVKAGDTVGGTVYFKPTTHWSGDTGFGYAAKDNQGAVDASPAKAAIHVEAVADAPQLSLGGYSSLASLNFEDVNLGGREWRQDVAVNKIGGANTIGVWNTDNGRGLIEVGTERTYTGGNSTNKVLEIENGPGDRTLYTDIQCEAGRFYQLGFDIAARTGWVSSSQLQVKLIALDAFGQPTGKTTVLYDFNPTGTGWLRDQQVALPIAEDGKYRLVFEAKDGDSYGAILNNLSFKAMDNVGYEGSFIKLSSINAALVDRDGSETLNVSLSGLPSGAVLKDAAGHQAAVDGSGKLDISNWSLDSLQLKGPAGYHGQLNLTVTATATEQSNHSQASSSQNLSVSIQAVDHPVTLSGLHALDGGSDAIVQESHLAAGTAPDAAQLTQQGSFVVNAPDGVASIRLGGVEVVGADGRLTGNTLSTAYGALKVTSFDAASGKLGYQYTLGHAGANAGERFVDSIAIDVRDRDGSSASDKLNVAIVNDAPLAADDRASLAVLSGDLKISSDGIVGNWVGWDGGHRVNTFHQGGNDDGQNQLRWGDTFGQQSGYSFRDNDALLNNTLPLNQTFKLGDLTHLNYEISGNSGISNATLGLAFTLGVQPQQFLVHLNHQETPNSRDYEASKDIVTIDNASQTFEYNGRQYILQILGFDDGKGHIGNEIHTAENASSTFGIMARIVEGSDYHQPATGGNVLQNDAAGADGGLSVVSCASGAQSGNGGVEAILHGQFGDLLMHADGSYNYTFTGDSKLLGNGQTDTFTYTVRDADGDLSSARLHIDLSTLDPNQRLLQGDAGDNRLTGTDANELIRGGAGNDILTGGLGVDTFKWTLGDQGTAAKPARDVITDFGQHGEKDVLDLKDLLQGESHSASSLEGYLNFHKEGANTVIDVHHQGQGTPVTQQIVLQNVDLTQGATLSDAQVLKNLLNHGQLHTD
ncbi:retention module-containing protein [Chromobacterium violaceum]|uniref:retention module-containing protein n=4 Tax=Chromobacterium violaceum TaxID=536 RepID=UPI003DA938F0